MIVHLLDQHTGRHAAAAASLLPAFLCRLRFPRLKPAAEDAPSLPSGLTVAQQAAHADVMHRSYAALADEQQYPRGEHPYPAYGTAPVADVLAAEQEAARGLDRQARAEAERLWYVRSQMPSGIGAPPPAVLERVIKALRADVPESSYRGGWQ